MKKIKCYHSAGQIYSFLLFVWNICCYVVLIMGSEEKSIPEERPNRQVDVIKEGGYGRAQKEEVVYAKGPEARKSLES